MSNLCAATVPLDRIARIEIYINSRRRTLAQILRVPGAREVMLCFFCYCALESTAGPCASSYLTLVRSRIMLQKARELLDGITPGSTVTLAVGRGKASQMAGQHRCSTKALTEEFGLKNIRITEKTELSGQEIQILDIEMPREM